MIRLHRTALWLCCGLIAFPAVANPLELRLGRNEVRVRSEAFPLVTGQNVQATGLLERLEALGYRRERSKPSRPGAFFYGFDNVHIYRRAHRHAGAEHRARLFTLELERDSGTLLGARDAAGQPIDIERAGTLWLEPQLLHESLAPDRALREPFELQGLPEQVWRPLLAIEDSRFFDHAGVDGRAVARALLANLKAGGVAQGGSTITQQLIKNRALTPKRSVGRKLSEAARALAMEVDFTKETILEAYLNHVYLGHVDGLALHGYGAASRAYFSKPAEQLDLAEAATLAAMVQGPNRLSPIRNPDGVRARRDRVLERMRDLGWAGAAEVDAALAQPLRVDPAPPRRPLAGAFLDRLRRELDAALQSRLERGRGVVVETTLDPLLQAHAEQTVAAQLEQLAANHPAIPRERLSAALVALHGRSGDVLAYVGGDPRRPDDRFDRASRAKRQPGSTVKPLLLLEAFADCGRREPLHPATRVDDGPLRLDNDGAPWRPSNFDRRHHGVVTVRRSLEQSYNLPFVRLARWCGFEATASRLRALGLTLPRPAPPAFALGAMETTPLELASAFTVFPGAGERARPRWWSRVERPAGGRLLRGKRRNDRVVDRATAYLVGHLLQGVVADGTGRSATLDGATARGKTGTSSDLRDAWFAGEAGGVVTVVWVGLDEGRLGLTGAQAAAPLWRRFMQRAATVRNGRPVSRPGSIVSAWVDPQSGLRVGEGSDGAYPELFRRSARPRRNRAWRRDAPSGVIP